MGQFRYVFFPPHLLIISFICFSCKFKSQQITYLDFLDKPSHTYNIMDTLKKNPLKTRSIYFLINQSKLKDIDFSLIDKFINSDSMIQKRIHESYSELSIIFLKKSKNTNELIRFKTHKMLTLCNDDMVIEFLWANGKPSDTIYYENGLMKGSENIKLYDLKER